MTTKPAEFTPPAAGKPCACGTGQTFADCCKPILDQKKPAATAEQLMRSRFTAHVARDYVHLHRTYAKTSKEPYVAEEGEGGRDWTRLVIHSHDLGTKPDMAFVDFTAYYREGDAEHAFHEKAEFQHADGTWLYTRPVRQGPAPIKVTQAAIGRNDPCPCGSGKKHKKCCLK